MAFKQGNNPISRKTSPMRMSPFTKQEPSMSMDELEKMSAAQDAASKAQAQQLPQIEGPGSPDYEAKTTMTYPGGEEGADYDEEGTQDGMSRKSSPANVKGSQSDHGQSSKEFAEHEARVGTDGHGPSRKSSPLNDEKKLARKQKKLAKTDEQISEKYKLDRDLKDKSTRRKIKKYEKTEKQVKKLDK